MKITIDINCPQCHSPNITKNGKKSRANRITVAANALLYETPGLGRLEKWRAEMAQTMTLKEKLAVSMQVFALRDAGKDAEADILVKTIPMPPYLAKIWKKHGYLDHFVKDGWNITEVEAAFGQEWINS